MRRPRAKTLLAVGGLALLLAGSTGCGGPEGWSVLLVSLDTVRRDHLSVCGHERPTSPGLERLAEGAVVFEEAITSSTQTSPAHGSFLTGLDPHVHGSEMNGTPIAEGVTTAVPGALRPPGRPRGEARPVRRRPRARRAHALRDRGVVPAAPAVPRAGGPRPGRPGGPGEPGIRRRLTPR